jgi:hypothetical protein
MDQYDYSRISYLETTYLPPGYKGNVYNMSYKWQDIIKPTNDPIKILEIGAYHGANVCCLTMTHALHVDSEIHCVDPWYDYDGYPEYRDKDEQKSNYSKFIHNISKLNPVHLNKIHIHRMKSEDYAKRFQDESFHIIYIDGNHEKLFVFEDALISHKMIKKGGWIVFDDAHDKQVLEAIQMFVNLYKESCYDEIVIKNSQVFMRRRV